MSTNNKDQAINQLDNAEARWFAIYVHYKREKAVQKLLQLKGIECYLPIQKVTRVYKSKIKKLDIPLINSYLFVKIVSKEYVPVLETPNVYKFIKVKRDLLAIPEREIDILKRIVGDKDLVVSVTEEPFSAGDKVEVIAGTLIGLKGYLVKVENKDTFVVKLENIGIGLNIEVGREVLKKV